MEDKVYELLNKLKIEYEVFNHEPLYTVAESEKVDIPLKGIGCKTLFLKDRDMNFYLYVLEGKKRANLKEISNNIGCTRFTFGNEEELYNQVKVHPGSVSPLGIINNEGHIILLIDNQLIGNFIVVHPNKNTSSISIDVKDLIEVANYCGNKYLIV